MTFDEAVRLKTELLIDGLTITDRALGTVGEGGLEKVFWVFEMTPVAHKGSGVGTLRIQAPTADEVRELSEDVRSAIRMGPLRGFELSVRSPLRAGRDTPLGWAPLWLPLSVALAMWLLPVAIWPRWRTWRRTGTMWGELDKGQFVHA